MKKSRPKPNTKDAKSTDILASTGIEAICNMILEGNNLTKIAKDLGVPVSTLSEWLRAEPERSARARDARREAARMWDEKAEEAIKNAKDWFQLHQAKELSQHYRWRSSKADPTQYGDKIDVTSGGEKIQKVEVEIIRNDSQTAGK